MSIDIPFADPSAGVRLLRRDILDAVAKVLDSGRYILGPQVTALENEFAEASGTRHCVAVASGTDALELALRANGIQPGEGVATVSHTAVATVSAIERCGAVPVLVDVDEDTLTLCPNHLEKTLAHHRQRPKSERIRVRAVIPVHLYGCPADMMAIRKIAVAFGLSIIEDCAQAFGAALGDKPVGGLGAAGAFSFYPTKNLGAVGDAGMVATDSESLAAALRSLRQYGWTRRYISDARGVNSRMDELQAAILRVRLTQFAADQAHRDAIAAQYTDRLRPLPIRLPPVSSRRSRHAHHLYVIRTERRDDLRRHLEENGIGTGIHYPAPVHKQPAYAHLTGHIVGGLPVTNNICRQILSLPMFPELEGHQIDRICETIHRFFSDGL